MRSPKKLRIDAAKRILKYMNSMLDLGLFYKKDIYLKLHGYVDADLEGDLDNHRSTSSYVPLYDYTCSKK